jgi:hypothetical protein
MCTVSFDKKLLNITIRNLYLRLDLTSPVYCSSGTVCHVSPSQQTVIGTTMGASFGIAFRQRNFKGALLYKLQRKYAIKTGNLPNSSTESIKDTATNTYLLVVWEIGDHYHGHRVCLIECTDNFTWDEDKLWALHHQYIDQLYKNYNYVRSTWLTDDNTRIRTENDITFGSDYKVDITISEGTKLYYASRPIQIDPKRLVLSLSILIILIYTASLSIQPSFKLNIHNQCLHVDLASPTYVTSDGLECHRPPDHKVHAGDTMKFGFIISKPGDEAYGVLIYGLQRRWSHESTNIDKGTSSAVQILVVWRISGSKKLYVDTLLVEHDKGFDWNEDDLRELYSKNFDRFRLCPDSATETWLLDDNTALNTIFKIRNGGQLLNITISEVEKDNTRMPVHIDSER